MRALGMIETIGIVGAIEATDVALKTADVDVVNRHLIKGGIVTVEITGDVAAVKVAVEAGTEAAKRLGVHVRSHVIARPSDFIAELIEKPVPPVVVIEEKKQEVIEEIKEVIELIEDKKNNKKGR
ncbi:BMC domain-containing protein [Cetobacterium sp. 2A]|uniref:BMC domain-containing protein n=1 Tax=unclassified Cetobacterium TaxID=2630983 RepID=UPI00163D0716|nr:BMC domain-containing protein [Cetobacterium sp. 2A]MBC2855068.1 BMC domain-containing protein [Cetobacterium sp. 2A]